VLLGLFLPDDGEFSVRILLLVLKLDKDLKFVLEKLDSLSLF